MGKGHGGGWGDGQGTEGRIGHLIPEVPPLILSETPLDLAPGLMRKGKGRISHQKDPKLGFRTQGLAPPGWYL